MMEKIKIVKNNLVRSIYEKDAQKWATRGYKRVEASKPAVKAATKAKS
jgi:hypothetical protein